MAKMNFKYDKNEDILYLFKSTKKVKFSLDSNDIFIIDFDDRNRVIGLEIIDASEVIYGLTKDALNNLKEVEMMSKHKEGILAIFIKLKSKKMKSIETRIPIPLAVR